MTLGMAFHTLGPPYLMVFLTSLLLNRTRKKSFVLLSLYLLLTVLRIPSRDISFQNCSKKESDRSIL